MKEFNNNIPLPTGFQFLNQHQKGRNLAGEFNKFTKSSENENENNKNNNYNNHINNNSTNANYLNHISNANYNISVNNFSFLTPIRKDSKEKKENNSEKESEAKNDIIKTSSNKIIINNTDNSDINNDTINTNENANVNENENANENANINANHNIFFTDYGLGYKCNCQKTQCNKYYCQCFNKGRYCFNCNCIDCNNKKPESIPTNKHQTEEEPKDKKEITISCTCTKSGCNKNYCECFKNKLKCNNSCRCINCENCEKEEGLHKKLGSLKNNFEYECCPANSVFIIKNKIVFENVDKIKINPNKKSDPIKREIRLMINDNLFSESSSEENKNIGNKRKRFQMEIEKNKSNKKPKIREMETEKSKSNKTSKLSEENENTNDITKIKKKNYFEESLFNKKGELILSDGFKF